MTTKQEWERWFSPEEEDGLCYCVAVVGEAIVSRFATEAEAEAFITADDAEAS